MTEQKGKNASLREIAELLKRSRRILVVSHVSPDADAYGSSGGLYLALKALGKEVKILNETGIIKRYAFIPGAKDIETTVPAGAWDCVVYCDCAELVRSGDTLRIGLEKISPSVNLDHHATNPFFATFNYVDVKASSAAEVVYDLLRELDPKLITPDAANALFAGLSGDTGSFRYQNTSGKTFITANELISAGASPYDVGTALHGNSTLSKVRLEAEALSHITLHADGKIAEVFLTDETYAKTGSCAEEAEHLVEKARDIEGIEISVLIRPEKGLWKVSLRSTTPAYDVSKIASSFGGGGHKVAAAFRWRKSVEELKTKLFAELQTLVSGK